MSAASPIECLLMLAQGWHGPPNRLEDAPSEALNESLEELLAKGWAIHVEYPEPVRLARDAIANRRQSYQVSGAGWDLLMAQGEAALDEHETKRKAARSDNYQMVSETISVPHYYITCYDRRGQRRLTAEEQKTDEFSISEYAEDGATRERNFTGSLDDLMRHHKEIGGKLIIAAPQPMEVATAFTNRFAKLLTGDPN